MLARADVYGFFIGPVLHKKHGSVCKVVAMEELAAKAAAPQISTVSRPSRTEECSTPLAQGDGPGRSQPCRDARRRRCGVLLMEKFPALWLSISTGQRGAAQRGLETSLGYGSHTASEADIVRHHHLHQLNEANPRSPPKHFALRLSIERIFTRA